MGRKPKSDPVKKEPAKKTEKEAEETSTTVAAVPSSQEIKLIEQFKYEGTRDLTMDNPTLKPSKAKVTNGFYPMKPSKYVNAHVRNHRLIRQPRKITHSKLGRSNPNVSVGL